MRRKLRYYYDLCARTDVNKNNKRYYGIEHPNQVNQYTSGTLFLKFVQQKCQNIARTIEISISLVH